MPAPTSPLLRLLVALLCAAIVVGGWAPLRLTASASTSDAAADERFPCEACGCGCVDAHECWTACCCHTPAERARWALANGVMIPRYATQALAAAEAVRAELEPGVDPAKLPACCKAKLLGSAAGRMSDPATCKARAKLAAPAIALLCLDLHAPTREILTLVARIVPAPVRAPAPWTPDPATPPPRLA
ncbi:MAG: hypothetical protein U0625_06310 [Phycisphaerales bacterium]